MFRACDHLITNSSINNFKTYFENRDYICITPTLRYHDVAPGDDPDPRLGSVSLLDYADDLEKLIRKFPEPPIIVGHSMGGVIGQILAQRGLAKALVLLTPASPSGIIPHRPSVIKSLKEESGNVYYDVGARFSMPGQPANSSGL